jgi:hypothetical protein
MEHHRYRLSAASQFKSIVIGTGPSPRQRSFVKERGVSNRRVQLIWDLVAPQLDTIIRAAQGRK